MLLKKELLFKIKERLNWDQDFLEWAIISIYKNQTYDEQNTNRTRHWNGIGFNKPDAKLLSSCATWILSGRKLTEPFLTKAKNRMIKYCRQLMNIPETLLKIYGGKAEEIRGTIEKERKKAVLIKLISGKEVWFPKSTIYSIFKEEGISQVFILEKWVVEKNLQIVK